MKTECLDNFYKDLDKEINKEYCIKIKNLIDADKLVEKVLWLMHLNFYLQVRLNH